MIRSFSIHCGKTINLGNYNSMKVEASLTIEVSEGEDYETLKQQAQDELNRLMSETYKSQRKGDE